MCYSKTQLKKATNLLNEMAQLDTYDADYSDIHDIAFNLRCGTEGLTRGEKKFMTTYNALFSLTDSLIISGEEINSILFGNTQPQISSLDEYHPQTSTYSFCDSFF